MVPSVCINNPFVSILAGMPVVGTYWKLGYVVPFHTEYCILPDASFNMPRYKTFPSGENRT